MMENDEDEYLLLKWGTIKDWNFKQPNVLELAQKWIDLGVSYSAMNQRDTPEQKALICQIIDALDGPITNDWSGENMTKDEAKKYVLEYSH